MVHTTCPTCGVASNSIHTREPGERFYEMFTVAESGCWEWTGGSHSSAGYGVFRPAPRMQMLAHRYSFALHNGHLDSDLLVCHSCDNPPCVNPAHLRLGTNLDNVTDMISRGRRGATHHRRPQKLSETKVQMMRELSAAGMTGEFLADTFGVSKQTVSCVIRRKTWAHVA